jgi:hypothetical protein
MQAFTEPVFCFQYRFFSLKGWQKLAQGKLASERRPYSPGALKKRVP